MERLIEDIYGRTGTALNLMRLGFGSLGLNVKIASIRLFQPRYSHQNAQKKDNQKTYLRHELHGGFNRASWRRIFVVGRVRRGSCRLVLGQSQGRSVNAAYRTSQSIAKEAEIQMQPDYLVTLNPHRKGANHG